MLKGAQDSMHARPKRKDREDHTVAVFTRLMLHDQVRSAVRFITDRVSGGVVLANDSPSGVPGKSVADILREKHPEPCSSGDDAFCLVIHFHLYLM